MKQMKLISLVALVLSLSVSAAYANTGKVDSDNVTGKMCAQLAASLIKQRQVAEAEVTPTPPVKVEPTSGVGTAM